jgi:ubiquinone/menaquinone biosynthesis C-methylase UbiE
VSHEASTPKGLDHDPHDWHSTEYVSDWIDRDVTRDATRRPRLVQMATLIPGAVDAPLRILDVGGGYGAVTSAVLDTRPGAHVVLHDYSAVMLDQARERLTRYGDRVRFVQADLADANWASAVGGPFDAVVSAIAIHNLFDADAIRRVYADIFGVLRPGGVFFNNDHIFPTGLAIATMYANDFGRDISEVRVAPGASLLEQLTWLRDAGFSEVDAITKDHHQTILCGVRAG